MSVITIKGSLAAFLQNEVYDFDPQHGWTYHADYKGASQAVMIALQNAYSNQGIASRMILHQGGAASLDLTDATQNFTIDTWQILDNEEGRDGLSHPKLTAVLNDNNMAIIRNGVNSPPESTTPVDDIYAKLTGFGGDAAALKRAIGRQLRGSGEYKSSQYVLHHETNAPARYAANIADAGKSRLYTTAQLLTEVQDSSLWIYPLPGRLVYKIGQIPVPASQAFYLWSWLKTGSTEQNVANNRISITTEYNLDLWNTDEYDPY